MEIRDKVAASLKEAMRAKDAARLSTLRLISAAIKDRDIAARAETDKLIGSDEQMAILAKMVRQRHESASVYEDAGRLELAEKERSEIKIIEEFLPRQLSQSDVEAAVDAAIVQSSAESLRDMGKIMGILKSKYTGQMDFGAAGSMIKNRLMK